MATSSFTVRVKGAAEQIADLIALVQSFALSPGTENSLLVKLQAAQAALSRGNINATCGNLKLFIHEVSAQAAKQQITEAQANLLIQEATRIEAGTRLPLSWALIDRCCGVPPDRRKRRDNSVAHRAQS